MRPHRRINLYRAVRVISTRMRLEDRCSIGSLLSRRPRWEMGVLHCWSCPFLWFDPRAAGFLVGSCLAHVDRHLRKARTCSASTFLSRTPICLFGLSLPLASCSWGRVLNRVCAHA